MRYFITFTCYGAHLHGDEIGSVERNHNVFGNRWAEPNRAGAEGQTRANQAPCFLDKGWIPERKRWARPWQHAMVVWKDENVQEAVRYVVSGQGEPMEVYLGELL